MRAALAIVAALAGLAVAAPAFAGEARCMWEALPASDQAAAIRTVQRDGPGALSGDLFSTEGLAAGGLACGVKEETGRNAGMALAGYVMELATQEQLERDFGTDGARLEGAWASLGDAGRQRLLTFAAAMGERDPAVMQSITEAVDGLDLPGEGQPDFNRSPQFVAASAFMLGRALRLANEPLF